MSFGEAAYLGLVLTAFFTFIGVVGFISIWSRRPRRSVPMQDATPQRHREYRKAA